MKWNIRRLIYLCIFLSCLIAFIALYYSVKMPGKSYDQALLALSKEEEMIKSELYTHIEYISEKVGERNLQHYDKLLQSADYIRMQFSEAGYDVSTQEFKVKHKIVSNIITEVKIVSNIIAEVKGSTNPEKIFVVGAHYDSAHGTKGANDNSTGVASMLVIARIFKDTKPKKTVRFVAFVNEEPPFFQSEFMGSAVYAKSVKEKNENIIGMLSLETMGYYSNVKNSQKYPFPFNFMYPDQGNFIAFIANKESKNFLFSTIEHFREQGKFPSEGLATLSSIPGIGWSDHWSFWQQGYPALMITDTALFRYPYYHTAEDTIDKIDFDSLVRVVTGIEKTIRKMVY